MPVYLLYGFRWPRAGFTGVRVYIVLNNLENATAEYLQQPETARLLLESFKKNEPDIVARLPEVRFIEQYDPEDISSETAVSQPYAYVAARVIEMPDLNTPGNNICWDVEELNKDSGLMEEASNAITEFRDKYAAGEKLGWYIVYNGDPERYFPETDEETVEEDDEDMMDEEYTSNDVGSNNNSGEPERPKTSSGSRFSDKITRLFKKNSNSTP
ncbi:uncharacterized protein ASPGLDRAFT_22416 [Aspergillus glaucus CBS 516.65]|uniref:Uncharacterized protein n=1 Tax=Aspergillus glaucus CBS 516.65 TaxID=1160497 RepID=A0A1L9VUJ8_ASPGL|nr:hypothetical protein ASPGLDRAFT_22416 [Aspergillus glaucus CBS 516.65]OJJ87566.1 hypothetical protein ASPGLDRAFT_22416 [Aspergillus glaucus CBS 516.65]